MADSVAENCGALMVDSWRVNSYGYPNPFTTPRAISAWAVFESFLAHNSYKDLKKYWVTQGANGKSAHGVESWKSNFEECGLLYVVARDDTIHITPGGRQLKKAADDGDLQEFAWVGTNLLIRYSLRGTAGRRGRQAPHDTSDVAPYWFVLSAALELDGFWQTELFRILCTVFKGADTTAAINRILECRAGTFDPLSLSDPATPGAAYNSLNQVAVKAGLNHLTLTRDSRPSPYQAGTDENYWKVSASFRPVLELALGGAPVSASGCSVASSSWVQRMPTPALYADEQSHFEAVGAAVESLSSAQQKTAVTSTKAPTAMLSGDRVFLLTVGLHCARLSDGSIEGSTSTLCVLARDQRVILNDDLAHTYLVVSKSLKSGTEVRVGLRKARPIQDSTYVRKLFEGASGGGDSG